VSEIRFHNAETRRRARLNTPYNSTIDVTLVMDRIRAAPSLEYLRPLDFRMHLP